MLIITTVDSNFRGKNTAYYSNVLNRALEGEDGIHNYMNATPYYEEHELSGYNQEVKLSIDIDTYTKIAAISKLTYESLGDTARRVLERELLGGNY